MFKYPKVILLLTVLRRYFCFGSLCFIFHYVDVCASCAFYVCIHEISPVPVPKWHLNENSCYGPSLFSLICSLPLKDLSFIFITHLQKCFEDEGEVRLL